MKKKSSSDIYLHVGLPKTGTTWIQNELFRHMDIQYIDYMYLYSYIQPDKKTVVSMESLSGVPDLHPYETRYQVMYRLKRMFPKAKILVGVRDKDKWIRSAYNEYVKGGGIYDWLFWRNHLFDDRYLQFDEYIDKLQKNFDEVFVYTLEEMQHDIHGFVKRICGFVDEPVPEYSVSRRNQSLNDKQLGVLRWINGWMKSEVNPTGLLPVTCGKWERTLVRWINHG